MEILEVRIQTTRPAVLRRFYADTLGLPVAGLPVAGFTATVGAAALTVAPAALGANPTYHLAFTVPRNMLASGKAWIAERTPLLTDADGRDEFRFDSWEASAVYFADPAGTILELIAWDALPNDAPGPFGPANLLAVSEVGLVVKDVPATVARLGDLGFAPYRSDWSPEASPDFAPVGDPTGRLIVVPPGRPWFPVGVPAAPAPLSVTIRGDQDATLTLTDGRVEVSARR